MKQFGMVRIAWSMMLREMIVLVWPVLISSVDMIVTVFDFAMIVISNVAPVHEKSHQVCLVDEYSYLLHPYFQIYSSA
jgi:hypothetical protein